MDLNIVSILLSMASLTCFMLGGVLYLQGGGGISSKLFAMVAICSGLWITDMVMSFYHYSSAGHSIPPFILTRISFAIAVLILYFFFLFAHSFPQNKLVIKKWFLIVTTAATALIIIFSFVPDAILRYDEFLPGDYLAKPFRGPAYIFLFVPVTFFFLFWGTALLIKKYLKSENVLEKLRLRYIIVGSIISGFVGITFDILSPYLPRTVGNLPIGHLGVFVFIVLSSYAILRHHLFSVKVIATELLTFSIWSFLLVQLFLSTGGLEFAINGLLLLVVLIFGALLIKSVLNEVSEREDLENVSSSLRDLKDNLEERIKEKTEEVKLAYEVEKNARIELQNLDKTKDQFILAAQHHLRTPLTILKGHLGIVASKDSLNKKTKDIFTKMDVATDTISKSVNNLLSATEVKIKEN